MSPNELRQLATGFEIGAHTLSHATLTELSAAESREQIEGSKDWVEQMTGQQCRLFCPPRGRFNAIHERQIAAAGFRGFRTTEMLALHGARASAEVMQLPTTIQAHPHHWSAYMRNGLRRRSPGALCRLLRHFREPWDSFARRVIEHASRRQGVFHLWGHSWEIEENDQWGRLERVFDLLSRLIGAGAAVAETNGSLCDRAIAEAGRRPGAAATIDSHDQPPAHSRSDRRPAVTAEEL
jgi:peptidoglycan/xylan/chitin deacetylase (PgdA/CDA1 family)